MEYAGVKMFLCRQMAHTGHKRLPERPIIGPFGKNFVVWGQSLVFLVLVTPKISLPVGFVFYQPAPELSAWYKQDKALKKQGVPKKQRPSPPPANPLYPTKQALALSLLAQFKRQHPDFKVNCITADALYGTASFVDGASAMFGGVQVISQIHSNQKVRLHKREQNVHDYFAPHPGTP